MDAFKAVFSAILSLKFVYWSRGGGGRCSSVFPKTHHVVIVSNKPGRSLSRLDDLYDGLAS